MQQGEAFLLNIFTFNYLQEYLVENPIQTLIIRCHIVFVWFTKRAWAACDETDQFVSCLVLPEGLSVKIVFHPRTVKRIVMAPMPSLLFRCFSPFLPHLRTLAQEKRSEIVFFLGLVGGVCFYPLLSRNI